MLNDVHYFQRLHSLCMLYVVGKYILFRIAQGPEAVLHSPAGFVLKHLDHIAGYIYRLDICSRLRIQGIEQKALLYLLAM
jgi:hypothetical protein